MRELYTPELVQLIKELGEIEGFYIDQFYELGANRFRLRISRKGEKANLQCIIPCTINRTDIIEVREDASNFSIAVRRRIGGARIKSVNQLNKDRIIVIELEKANAELRLILEMFGKGNMIIADSTMSIQLAYHTHDFKDRSIRPGNIYKQPQNTTAQDEREIKDERIINYLNRSANIGTIYAEEAIKRSDLDPKTKLKEIDKGKHLILRKNLDAVMRECSENPKFIVYKKGEAVVNFALCEISKYSELERQGFDSFEKCLDFFYRNFELKRDERNEEEEKTTASIEKQQLILKGIEKEIEDNKKIGDYIINHMHEINTIIDSIRSNKNATKQGLQALSREIEILSINMKSKSIKIRPKDGEE